MNKKLHKVLVAIFSAGLLVFSVGCAASANNAVKEQPADTSESADSGQLSNSEQATGVIAPVTVSFDELDSVTIELVVDQALNINTGDIDTREFAGESEHPEIAEFVPGKNEGDAVFNPGFVAVSEGETLVKLTWPVGNDAASSDSETETLTFAIVVNSNP